ncbi:hypothetical protein RB68_012 [Enterobacteria phage RB68]|uniref:Uncharacterized protein motB.1 n=1 Tax=Enterobacteria phage RB51 TaxID=10693 RepID=C3V1Z8_BPR51|nr:hypothetical protein RB51ORF012 [Enterobacteria phage RB51]YP_009167381.1 hypothetical protein RB68_012 [Enterobacteria phage RB68]ACP30930.1 hypothetical protein RB51ORF012 [Enterobacteria phage RB51]AIT75472.1 hypothetical protein RB68_012 [Enterobacteria phage RB68]UJJ74396.1 hypothetical protein CPTAc3_012 [Enterobacteria phage Ac3]
MNISTTATYILKDEKQVNWFEANNGSYSKFCELIGVTQGKGFTIVNAGPIFASTATASSVSFLRIKNLYGTISTVYITEQDFELLIEEAPVSTGLHFDMDIACMYGTLVKPIEPTDLLCKAVSIRRPFAGPVSGWVTDQWLEDGVELLNVVHAGDFSVVPRSAVINILN